MEALIIGGLIYIIMSLPAVILVFLVNKYIVNTSIKSLTIKRNVMLFLLCIIFTPIMKIPGAALISIHGPSYTILYDLIVSGKSMHLNYYVYSHTAMAIAGLVVTFTVSAWVTLQVYPTRQVKQKNNRLLE